MGEEAIRKLLQDIDLDKEVEALKEELKTVTGQRRTRAIRRLEVMEAFRNSGNDTGWMVLDVLPVIPPEIRRSEEHTSELQSRGQLVCRLLLEIKKAVKCCDRLLVTTVLR